MRFNTESGEQMACAVLAAQVAVLRDRIDTGATVDLLWRTTDVLSQLSKLLVEFAKRCSELDPELNGQCHTAIAAEAEISRSLESLAFEQAQRNDFTCQTVDCVVTALKRLAATDVPAGSRLSPNDLAALYVSEDQHRVHEAAAHQFAMPGSSERTAFDSPGREEPGK